MNLNISCQINDIDKNNNKGFFSDASVYAGKRKEKNTQRQKYINIFHYICTCITC